MTHRDSLNTESMERTADERELFLAQQREITRKRYDELHSLHYDELWGATEPLHAEFVLRLADRLSRGANVLDAACGTGKYWPALIAAGVRVLGVDHSAGMLARAREKHREVPTRLIALQDIAAADDLADRFDAVICIDSMEFVGPEDWPKVVGGFARALRPGGRVYLTVELPEQDADTEPRLDPRQVAGESIEGGGYHHYPGKGQVVDWLADAGFVVEDQAEGEWYWHLLARLGPPR